MPYLFLQLGEIPPFHPQVLLVNLLEHLIIIPTFPFIARFPHIEEIELLLQILRTIEKRRIAQRVLHIPVRLV